MKVIFKYALGIKDFQTVQIPKGADLLCVVAQYNKPVLYAIVDPRNEVEGIGIFIITTGGLSPPSPSRYLGTFLLNDDTFVGHAFVGKKI